jgi:hypothetical protein
VKAVSKSLTGAAKDRKEADEAAQAALDEAFDK